MYLFRITILLVSILHSSSFLSFSSFADRYEKSYQRSSQEFSIRQDFYSNAEKRAIQLEPNVSYIVGENQYWDSSDQQKKRLSLSVNKLDIYANNFDQYLSYLQQKNNIKQLRQSYNRSDIDWRAHGAVTSVKNQGRWGTTWSFATISLIQSYTIITVNNQFDFSEQQLIECTLDSSNKSGYIQFALNRVITSGILKQSEYSYSPSYSHKNICDKHSNYVANHYYRFQNLDEDMIINLLNLSPVLVKVSSENWLYYKKGVYYCQGNLQARHAVLLVGVTPLYWIAKNSWGIGWGELGYIRISRQKGKNCGIGTQVYVLWSSHYITTIFLVAMLLLAAYF